MPLKIVPPYLDLNFHIKVGKQFQSNYVSSTREGLKALGHINRVCKVHLTLILIIRVHPCNLGTPPLLHPGLHLLLGLTTLHIILSLWTNHFSSMFLKNLSGKTHHKGGWLNIIKHLLECLHPNLNLSLLMLLHPSCPRCLHSPIRTWTIDRYNKFTMERHPIQLMLWRYRRLISGREEYSQITILHLHL